MGSTTSTLAAAMVGNPARLAELVVFVAGVLTFVAAVIWTVWIIAIFRRDVRRARLGRCMECGYDVSFSTGQCPECGAVIRK